MSMSEPGRLPPSPSASRRNKSLLGLVQRRECFVPTLRGWVSILVVWMIALAVATRFAYSFLASNHPLSSEILVVEGWEPRYAMDQAVAEFNRGRYRTLFVTGGAIEEGSLLSEYKTYANLGGTVLQKSGFPGANLQIVPAPQVKKDRTFQSALALKDWMTANGGIPPTLNVVSLGTHSRRTHLLFEKAFGNQSRVGIIAVENRDFDPASWWHYSQGVRSVVDETVAYLYALLWFKPDRP